MIKPSLAKQVDQSFRPMASTRLSNVSTYVMTLKYNKRHPTNKTTNYFYLKKFLNAEKYFKLAKMARNVRNHLKLQELQ